MKESEPRGERPKITMNERDYEGLKGMSDQFSVPVEVMLDLIITEYISAWMDKAISTDERFTPEQAKDLLMRWNRRN
jgi:hypothetical protein